MQPWLRDTVIGALQDTVLYSLTHKPDVNFDMLDGFGNKNGIHEINETIEYTSYFDGQFNQYGIKNYDCGFKDDLLSLRGITGKVVTIDTVSGSFHIEDTLSICAQTLRMEDFAKFYLFDSDLIIEDTTALIMGDTTAIIARSGDCRIIVKGSLTLGNGVTFEARDSATLEIIFENDADLAISNATFINCTLELPKRNLFFNNCHFLGTPLVMDNTVPQSAASEITSVVTNCEFSPYGNNINNALYIKNFAHYKVNGCKIDANDGGTFKNGIAIYNCGSNSGWKQVHGNDVSGCLQAGIQMYASSGNITMNTVYGNGYGIKLLNNCNISSLSGNCGATLESDTQFIHDNTHNEIYMTGSSIPQRFRYNVIHHDGNIPYVNHDAYIAFGDENRGSIDVKYNYWGNGFTPSTHLHTNLIGGTYVYNPQWILGDCYNEWVDAAMLLNEADSLNDVGAYAEAQFVYKQVVEYFPETVSAETAMKSLLSLEAQLEGDYLSLKNYYQTNSTIAADETLSHLASSLANKCDEELRNYIEAIAWYENVLTDSMTSFNDSIFAAIDLGELYLKMEANGEKGACGNLLQYNPKTILEQLNRSDLALAMLPRRIVTDKNQRDYPPIQDLEISVGENDAVILTWNQPNDSNLEPMTLSWLLNDTINDHVQAGYDSYMGNLYDTLDLRNLIGWKIETVSFYKCSNWTHVVYVFEQKRGEEMRVLYNQEISDEMPFGLNTIRLDEDLFIEPSTQYWFALRIKRDQNQQGYTYPFGMVWGEQGVEGKSNLYLEPGSNSWIEIPLWDVHFWIRACLSNPTGEAKIFNVKNEETLTGYRIYRDDQLIKEIPYSFVTYYTDTEFTKGFDMEYCVTAVYGDEESDPVCATATITGVNEADNDGIVVSPNPTIGLVRIEGATATEVRVYNAIGQLLKTARNTNEINMKGLPRGIYMLHIMDENGAVATRKLVLE
ncbi:MAG: T9SS type A sorting domain-containing protein [Bacteroidales bacterium]|nr:T9SS type A sorting domain-containing protein [Bacteroidales bacterium]